MYIKEKDTNFFLNPKAKKIRSELAEKIEVKVDQLG
jgi:hypothetical protein